MRRLAREPQTTKSKRIACHHARRQIVDHSVADEGSWTDPTTFTAPFGALDKTAVQDETDSSNTATNETSDDAAPAWDSSTSSTASTAASQASNDGEEEEKDADDTDDDADDASSGGTDTQAETTQSTSSGDSAKTVDSSSGNADDTPPDTSMKTVVKKHRKAQRSAQSIVSSVGSIAAGLFSGGQGTYYYQEGATGACGTANSDSAMIVALSASRFQPSHCGKSVKVTNTANGKSVIATVADRCPGCAENSLDMSTGSYSAIGEFSTGVLPISWGWA
ncbi:uncharacterized protein L969DRAFT_90414 [Mixia osmundae IAM 14324]|nr:uncharacterized protein L969DRAFT_90414 [Mixia osmundae IAM 14324]KEI36875.1 hypothetical protein L969DRAFT_90414 [Mixia osmundae IAM 14324]